MLRDGYARLAWYVDRVLHGGKPAEMAVERPSRFELVVNMSAVSELGITIPQSVLVRADRVLE